MLWSQRTKKNWRRGTKGSIFIVIVITTRARFDFDNRALPWLLREEAHKEMCVLCNLAFNEKMKKERGWTN